ncbi:MAG: TonB-dependent receptor domain-containing protein [Flavitalea sp.]
MKKINYLLASFLTLSMASQAQTKNNAVSGSVTDGKNILTAATVSLLHQKDSSLVKMTVSDKSGKFSFDGIKDGPYLVSVSAIGYEPTYSKGFETNGTAVDLAVINLQQVSSEMKAVTVIAKKPMIEQKIDRMIVNVDAAISNVGTNALEVLEKSPGVLVDKDGNISLKGKQGVMVMLDGRPTYLTGPELANLLKGMQSSQLETIEIMTNPPAKYDASGNSGVINIKTKKNKMKGFNGSFTLGVAQGAYFKTNESININYRNNKVNLFSSYSLGWNNNFQELDIARRFKDGNKDLVAIFEQNTLMKSRRLNNNLKVGMDYFLNKKTTLGFVASGFSNPEENSGINTSYLMSPSRVIDSIVTSSNTIKEKWNNASLNLNIRHQYDSTGREITADIDFIRYDANSDQNFLNTTFSPTWIKRYDEKLKGDLPVNINIYSAKFDYTYPLKKDSKLEFGAKTSFVNTENKAKYFEGVNDEWEIDYRKTNFFNYKENVNAAYVNFNKQFTPKIGVQAGLRFENTNYDGYQYGNPTRNDSSFSKTYNDLFPTVYVSYKADKNNQFGINFGRRIDRPAYQDLNPFLFFIDKYTYGQGNPYLKPQYSNNVELSHILKDFLTTTVNYGVTNNLFIETFDQADDINGEYNYITIFRQGNIGKMTNAGISINVQKSITSWWSTVVYANYNYRKFKGHVNNEMVEVEGGNFVTNINNQFKFPKGWSAEISGWYRTKGVEGQIVIDPMGACNVGVGKQVLKNKGTLKLNVRDLFYTQVAKGQINFESTEASFRNFRDTRVVNLTFSYRFGKPMNGGNSQRKKGGANEEENRVKSNN